MPPIVAGRYHGSSNGNEPARDRLKRLPADARKAIGADIRSVQFGWPLGMPPARKIEAGLWEVRSDIPGGMARMLFTTAGPVMVLPHGFVKKSTRPRKRT